MIIINGHKFAKNDRNFIKTLFEKDGTAYGYYKRKKGVILFQTMKMEIFAALVCNENFCSFVNASEREGKIFYQYDISDTGKKLFGIPEGYLDSIEYAKTIFNQLKGIE